MALVCRNNLSSCTGCSLCLETRNRCDSCNKLMKDGEKYYRLSRKNICTDCTEEAEEDICILCRGPARDGFRYKNVTLCRSCSRVATGYVGYI